MQVTISIRKDNEDKWKKIPNKSGWVNTLLANSDDTSLYGLEQPSPAGPMVTVLSEKLPKPKKQSKKQETFNELKEQLENVCNGEHYMSRVDCGKKNCPWSSIKA